jgi:2-polyprenyl-3-methyl-5-hydroxy-6-metoxy-1,4-benzoquinol methylase
MPLIEQKALELSYGKILDVGCGAGSHSLFLQNQKKLNVIGLDNSAGAVRSSKERGLIETVHQSIFDYQTKTFDTILMLMNGIGICGRLEKLEVLLKKLKRILNPDGQILLDSSDLIYLFDETTAGEKIISAESYYGELEYGIKYQDQIETFPWLYVGFDLLSHAAKSTGLAIELILEGENWDYLARLTREY